MAGAVDFSDTSGTKFKKYKEEAHVIKIEKKKENKSCCTLRT